MNPTDAPFETLSQIVEQLRSCGYVCEAGPLEGNEAFIALERMAAQGPLSDSEAERWKLRLGRPDLETL